MKKELFINDITYDFFFDEGNNMWRLIDNKNLIDGNSVDLEIDLGNLAEGIKWDEIEKFIKFISSDKAKVFQNIRDARTVLQSFYRVINKDVYDHRFFDNIHFNITGIDYKGHPKNVNLINSFEYDYFFFPQYTKDIYRDIGSFVWRVNFRDNLLLGVYCDRL